MGGCSSFTGEVIRCTVTGKKWNSVAACGLLMAACHKIRFSGDHLSCDWMFRKQEHIRIGWL
jgi:hypothetical protein